MWVVAKTKPNQELRAQENLKNQGFTPYLPKIVVKKYIKSSWVKSSEIMFPGYIFIKGKENIHKINYTYGVSRLLANKSTGIPYLLEDSLVNSMPETLCTSKGLKIGDEVEYVKGSVKKLRGILTKICNKTRVKILLDFIFSKQEIIVSKSDIQEVI